MCQELPPHQAFTQIDFGSQHWQSLHPANRLTTPTLADKQPVPPDLTVPPAVSAQFFWASPTGGFSAAASNARPLKAAETVGEYLFKIGDGGPLGKLRFDPFSDLGQIRIESLTIYRLVE